MNNNYKGEVIVEYETASDAIKELKCYIEDDMIYHKYINKEKENYDDFDIYCINHIHSILKLIEEYTKLKREMEKMNNENIKHKKI